MSLRYDAFFQTATGFPPYHYHCRSACGEREGRPEAARRARGAPCQSCLVNIPTGLGKTAAVPLSWLWNRLFPSPNSQSTTPHSGHGVWCTAGACGRRYWSTRQSAKPRLPSDTSSMCGNSSFNGAARFRARNFCNSRLLPTPNKRFNGAALNRWSKRRTGGVKSYRNPPLTLARCYWRSNQFVGFGRTAETFNRTADPSRTAPRASRRRSFPMTSPQQFAVISREPAFGLFRRFDIGSGWSRALLCFGLQ